MRIYIIGNDGITLFREPPATVNKGEVAVASREELYYTPPGSAANACWRCGTRSRVSRSRPRSVTAIG